MFSLFNLFTKYRSIKQGVYKPEEFAQEQAVGALLGAFLVPVLILIGFFVLIVLLAFTSVLGGPYTIAKVFFWFLFVIYFSVGYLISIIIKTIRKGTRASVSRVRENVSNFSMKNKVVRDAEVTEIN